MAKEKILVVDDEQDLVKLIRYHLEKDGYRVLSAYNGEESLEQRNGSGSDRRLL